VEKRVQLICQVPLEHSLRKIFLRDDVCHVTPFCPVGLEFHAQRTEISKEKSLKTEFVEQLEVNPARLLPETAPHLEPAVDIDLNPWRIS
jgi:fumarate hydratase class I